MLELKVSAPLPVRNGLKVSLQNSFKLLSLHFLINFSL